MTSPVARDLLALRNLAAERIFALPGIIGVGIGGKIVAGRPTGRLALKVLVDDKLPLHHVPHDQLIPDQICGIDVDVERGSRPSPHGLLETTAPGTPWLDAEQRWDSRDQRRYRPLLGGAQIRAANQDPWVGSYGTLGCVLEAEDPSARDGSGFGVTNLHVVSYWEDGDDPADPPRRVGYPELMTTQVFQPDHRTQCAQFGDTAIGTVVADSSDQSFGVANSPYSRRTDAALIQLASKMDWKPAIADLGGVRGIATDLTPENVCSGDYKVVMKGRTSGIVAGTILCISFWYRDPWPSALGGEPPVTPCQAYITNPPPPPTDPTQPDPTEDLQPPTPDIRFHSDIVVRPNENSAVTGWEYFGLQGDSGAAVLNERREVIGIYHSGPVLDPELPISFETHGEIVDGFPPDAGDGFITPICEVLDVLNNCVFRTWPKLSVAVAEADDLEDIAVRRVP